MSNARADYEEEETTACDFPEGSNTIDDRYVAPSDREGIPVIPDEAPVEQPTEEVDPDSDEMLGTIQIPVSPVQPVPKPDRLIQKKTKRKPWMRRASCLVTVRITLSLEGATLSQTTRKVS